MAGVDADRTLSERWQSFRAAMEAAAGPVDAAHLALVRAAFYGGAAAVLRLVDDGYHRLDARWLEVHLQHWADEIRSRATREVEELRGRAQ